MDLIETDLKDPVHGQVMGVSREELAEKLTASAHELLRIADELRRYKHGGSCSECRGDIRIETGRRDFDMTSILRVNANFIAVLSN